MATTVNATYCRSLAGGFGLAYVCNGPSCSDLDDFPILVPNITCDNSATSNFLNCSNEKSCAGSNYINNFIVTIDGNVLAYNDSLTLNGVDRSTFNISKTRQAVLDEKQGKKQKKKKRSIDEEAGDGSSIHLLRSDLESSSVLISQPRFFRQMSLSSPMASSAVRSTSSPLHIIFAIFCLFAFFLQPGLAKLSAAPSSFPSSKCNGSLSHRTSRAASALPHPAEARRPRACRAMLPATKTCPTCDPGSLRGCFLRPIPTRQPQHQRPTGRLRHLRPPGQVDPLRLLPEHHRRDRRGPAGGRGERPAEAGAGGGHQSVARGAGTGERRCQSAARRLRARCGECDHR